MSQEKKIVLGISCGDINGVGLETLIKAFSQPALFDLCVPVLYAPQSVVDYYKQRYGFSDFKYRVIKNVEHFVSNKFNLISFYNETISVSPGLSSDFSGKIAGDSLDLAIQDLHKSAIDVLVTLPINKYDIALNKQDFLGHTEYLSQSFGGVDDLMILCNEHLRIATVTNHIPLINVSQLITKKLIHTKLKTLLHTLSVDFMIREPKIAVLGLNPHAGDNGLIGQEDKDVIQPVVQSFVASNKLVYGPYSADGFFGSGNYKNFDATLAMYHDQALIPFKVISFGAGVNYTAGLPIIRVSPDHGVGYDIAGMNKAKEGSLLSAILLGIRLYKNRKSYFVDMRKTNNVS